MGSARVVIADLVDLGDIDALVGHVGSLVLDERWDDIVALHDSCRAALARGKQLWPASAYAEYRLALDAPGSYAAAVLGSSAERFTLGPFSEVAASRHAWSDLAPRLDRSPGAAAFAHERVVRGEDLRGDAVAVALPPVFDLPLALQAWEPQYPVAEYLPDRARFDPPTLPQLGHVEVLDAPAKRISDPVAIDALLGVVSGWVQGSTGQADAFAVEGDAGAAIAAAGNETGRLVELGGAVALAIVAWAGASGGAAGRRRGMAAGRSAAWWLATVLAGFDDLDGNVDPDELGDAIGELRWYLWDAGDPKTGWSLRLAVEDPVEGLAWVLRASDSKPETTGPAAPTAPVVP